MNYVVCQTGSCQQTYPMKYFGEITKDTKNVNCEKCGGILIDEDGRATFSHNATVIPVIKLEELEEQQQRKLEEKRKELSRVKKELKLLEAEAY